MAMKRAAKGCIASLVVSLAVGVAPKVAGAQDSLERQVTGGSSRAWTLHRFTRATPPGDGCRSGETYTFDTSHELTINRCLDGKAVASRHGWSISTLGRGGPVLAITGMDAYSLTFHAFRQGGRLMRLRAEDAGPGKPASDKELVFDED